jgi:hypothetical protein
LKRRRRRRRRRRSFLEEDYRIASIYYALCDDCDFHAS